MGRMKDLIRERIEADRERCRRDGLVLTDEEFDELEAEIDGRHGMGSWAGVNPRVEVCGVKIRNEDGHQRRWPKADGEEVWTVHYERPDGFLNLYGVFSSPEKAEEAKETLLRCNPGYRADVASRVMDEACFNPVILP